MRVALSVNINKDNGLKVTSSILKALDERGVEVLLYKELRPRFDGYKFGDIEQLAQNCDIMIAAGGDGTVLTAAKAAAKYSVPVLGVNLGNVGFLAETEPSNVDAEIEQLLEGKYTIEERAMLKASYDGNIYYALNDFVVSKLTVSRMITLNVYVDNTLVDRYAADGFIVSTPTGSTAYSLSAGGPVLNPFVKGFVLTPICAHSIRTRPIVIGEDETVLIEPHNKGTGAMLIADGVTMQQDEYFGAVTITKADISARFIRTKKSSFYSRLFNKLNIWCYTESKEGKG